MAQMLPDRRYSIPDQSLRVEVPMRPQKPTQEQISRRAYGIDLSRGSAGDAVADWLQAQRELAKRD